jgi:hypothetical protein
VTTAVLVAGCDGPSGTENVSVTMQQSDATFSASLAGWSASVMGGQGSAVVVSKDTVLSLTVEVTEIQFLPKEAEAQAGDDGVWISLSLAQPVPLDLMTLPTEGQSPLVIASGEVPVGSYGDVRLFVENAQIVFKGDINLGVAFGFEGGVAYPVEIPSGPETGIKTDAEFSVTADAEGNVNDVHLLFSPTATFLNVSGTGTGEVILAPVIRSRPEGL